jgi:cell division protein FtsI/penicillin-binding protein 2
MRLPISVRGYLKLLSVVQAGFLIAFAVAAMNALPPSDASTPPSPPSPAPVNAAPSHLTKHEVQALLADAPLLNWQQSSLDLRKGSETYTVRTTLDPQLQSALLQRLDLKNSRYVGIVVMDSQNGRVLAMVGHDRTDASRNPCIDSRFPAASVFKIITAAAAVETCDLDSGSVLNYSGDKHTLYKSQIQAKSPKSANRTTLKESFAQSINPVFGRLGAHALGRDVIAAYAEAFGFNQEIDFELPIRPSRIELSDEPFDLAEIASGFNRTTLISPLHGALMAAAVVNQGRPVEPTIVDEITAEDGRSLYRSRAVLQKPVIDPETSRVLSELMQATVRSGTARREFNKHADPKLFARLKIGGKTGSISDGTPDARYDWFVGYARENNGDARIVFAVVVAHEEFIGTRAAAYAALAIKTYFRSHFAAAEPQEPRS